MEAKLLAVFSSGFDVNVRALCDELEISRQSFYKYRRRWLEEGAPGLVERSRRPRSSPKETPPDVEDEIVRLRKDLVVDNGAQAIAWHLERRGVAISSSTAHRVLVRRGMVEPQPQKRPKSSWRSFEWPRPNDAWQIDATKWVLSDHRDVWIMDVLDDHSRVLVAARVCEGPTSAAAWDALAHGIAEWGRPRQVMSDNGTCFTARFTAGTETDFERTLRDIGIRHIPSSPCHPQTCGKLERSHQTTKRWLAAAGLAPTPEVLQQQLDDWRGHYNAERPHSAANGKTPLSRWQATRRARPRRGPIPATPRTGLHRISTTGAISWGDYTIAIDSRLAGEQALVFAKDLDLTIYARPGLVRQLTIDPTRRYQGNGRPPGRRKDHLVSAMSR